MRVIRRLRNRSARSLSGVLFKILLTDQKVRRKIIALQEKMLFGEEEEGDGKT
jgi:hypothetical protein